MTGARPFDSRLAVPLPPARPVVRERLRRLLDVAAAGPVTVVTGAAGTGKTCAVADWARHAREPVAWATLDRADNDPARLRTTIRAAADEALAARVPTVEHGGAGADLDDVADHPLPDMSASTLAGQELVLVLDDVHEIDDPGALAVLDVLLNRRVPGLHVVLVARHVLALSLSRLRVDGGLAEVRGAELALTETEAGRLLVAHGARLPPRELALLLETTRGWAAGLRIAAMTLADAADPADAVRRFDGSHAVVTGYLLDEVLARAAPACVELLLGTCVVTQLCGPLARALTGRSDAGALLESLAAANALVERVDGGWFRYHPMLRQMLRARLDIAGPERAAEQHRRASAWFEGAAEPLAALEHAVAAADWSLAGVVMMRSAVVAMFSADRGPLAALVDRIPDAVAVGRPELEAARAVGAYCRDEPEAVHYHLDRARAGAPALPEPRRRLLLLTTSVLAAFTARDEGDAAALGEHGAEAAALVAELPADAAPGWSRYRKLPLVLWATGEMWLGHPERAASHLAQARPEAGLEQLSVFGRAHLGGYLALATAARGQIVQARRIATGVLRTAEAEGSAAAPDAAVAWLALAVVELARGDLDGTARALAGGERSLATAVDPFVRVCLTLVAAGRAVVAGDQGRARGLVAEADEELVQLRGAELVHRLRSVVAAAGELSVGRAVPAADILLVGRPAGADGVEGAAGADGPAGGDGADGAGGVDGA
ncbi:AAA family ATPase, partial [Georgenia subflava]